MYCKDFHKRLRTTYVSFISPLYFNAMKFFKSYLIYALSLFSFNSCENEDNVKEMRFISVANEFGTYNILNLSDYVTDIKYIPLETNDSVILAEIKTLVYENGKIMIIDRGSFNCWVFDNEGKLYCKIDDRGQGPNEYIGISDMFVYENLIYLRASPHMLLIYDLNGKFIRKINSPKNMSEGLMIRNFQPLKSNIFFMDMATYELVYNPKAALIEVEGDSSKIVKEFIDPIKVEKDIQAYLVSEVAIPYHYKGNVRLYRRLNCDTIYMIGEDFEMKEAFIFNFGKYKPTMDFLIPSKNRRDRYNSPITVDIILESPQYLFINFNFFSNAPEPFPYWTYIGQEKYQVPNQTVLGVFNKNTGKLNLMKQPIKGELGFCNDVDGGLVIWPQYISTNDEIVTSISADAF